MIYLFSPQYFQNDISSLYCSLLEPGRTRPLEHHCRLSLSQHRHVCVSKTLGKKVFVYGLYKECFNLEESMVEESMVAQIRTPVIQLSVF